MEFGFGFGTIWDNLGSDGGSAPVPPSPGPLTPVFDILDGATVQYLSIFGNGFIRGVGLNSGTGPTGIAATANGTPLDLVGLSEEETEGGLVLFVFAASGFDPGSYEIEFSGNVGKASLRIGDVVSFDAATDTFQSSIATAPLYAAAYTGVAATSDLTMVAGSNDPAAWDILISNVLGQGGTLYDDAIVSKFAHRPAPNAAAGSIAVTPQTSAHGGVLAVEVEALKPIVLDVQTVGVVDGNTYIASAGPGAYRVYYGGISEEGDGIRWNYRLGQLKNDQLYRTTFNITSLSPGHSVYIDVADGDEIGPFGLGHNEIVWSRPSFDATYRFIDFWLDQDYDYDIGFTISDVETIAIPDWDSSDDVLTGLDDSLFEFWDADDADSLTLVSTDHVSAWVGLKNAISLGQGSDARRPQYQPSGWGEGKPQIFFEGSVLRNLITTSFTHIPTGATPFEVWAIIDQPDVAGTKEIVGWPGNTTGKHADITYFKDPNNHHRLNAIGTAPSANVTAFVPDGMLGKVILRGRWETDTLHVGLGPTYDLPSMVTAPQTLDVTTSGTFAVGSGPTNGGFWGGGIRKLLITKPLDPIRAAALYHYLTTQM